LWGKPLISNFQLILEAEPNFKSIVCRALNRDDGKCPVYVVFALLGCYAVLIGSY
jgi:hypothetical protein